MKNSSRGEEARRRLMTAGLEIFGRYGFETATTRQIAEQAGVNLSAITYHFGNKMGLYQAVVGTISERMSAPLVPVGEHIRQTLEQKELSRADCIDLLLQIIDALARNILDISHQEARLIVPIWIREQIDPTPAFDILYKQVMGKMLLPCSALLGRLLNRPPDDPECRLRVFALVGQIIAFRLVRLAVLRTAGWEDYDAERIAFVRQIIRQHTLGILSSIQPLTPTSGMADVPPLTHRPETSIPALSLEAGNGHCGEEVTPSD